MAKAALQDFNLDMNAYKRGFQGNGEWMKGLDELHR